jgi:galactokinase
VSGKELDTIVQFAEQFQGCIGARMTGAGFGGCAIALVETDKADAFRAEITVYYTMRVGYAPEIFEADVADGVKKVRP